MLIGGLQKTSLIDYPEKLAAIIFTCGCNFRCNFCYNIHLIENPEPIMTEDDVFEFLEKRKKYLDAVVIGGGEPTIQKDIIEFIKKIKEMGYLVKLDTNGAEPEVIEELIDRKLVDYIAMDIKAPLDLYREVVNVDIDKTKIKKSISLIMNSGVDYEFRTTVYPKLTKEHFKEILQLIQGAKKYYIQQYEPKTTLKKENLKPYDAKQIEEIADIAKQFVEKVEIRNVEG
jgi:pyruvate formate lyase activating enzyme